MEIWLKDNDKQFRVPVLPAEIEFSSTAAINSININAIGEVALFGGSKPSKVAFSSFLPNKAYKFCEYKNISKPYDSVKLLESWNKKGTVLRLIIPQSNINMEIILEDFTYKEQDGSGDVYYNIVLTQFIRLKITKVANVVKEELKPSPPPPAKRPAPNKPKTKVHTVVKGDTLWGISKKYYGDGSKYPKIHNANKNIVKNPNLIYPGQKLTIP